MQFDKKSAIRLLLVVCGAILFYSILDKPAVIGTVIKFLFSLVFPLLLGVGIAFVLNLPMRALEKHIFKNTTNKYLSKLRRPVCIIISLVIIIAVVWLIMALVLPEFINAITTLISYLPKAFTTVQAWLVEHAGDYPEVEAWIQGLSIDWASVTKNAISYVTNGATNLLGGTVTFVTAFAGGFVNAFIGIIFAIYILSNKETLKRQTKSFLHAALPAKAERYTLYVVRLVKNTFASYVTGQCLEACILGSLCFAGMMILHLPYAPMIAALVAFMQLVPIVGAFCSLIIGSFMILMVNPVQALEFAIFLLILQQIEGNLIYPHVVGSQVGLPGIWVLACITVGGSISGLVGMLFAVPVGSVLYTLARNWVHACNEKKANIDLPE